MNKQKLRRRMHRWLPTKLTACRRRIDSKIITNVGYRLTDGVTCKQCQKSKTRMIWPSEEWNGQHDGHDQVTEVLYRFLWEKGDKQWVTFFLAPFQEDFIIQNWRSLFLHNDAYIGWTLKEIHKSITGMNYEDDYIGYWKGDFTPHKAT